MMQGKAAPSWIGPGTPLLLWAEMACRAWDQCRGLSPFGRAWTDAERVFWRAYLEVLAATQSAVRARLSQLGADAPRSAPERIPID